MFSRIFRALLVGLVSLGACGAAGAREDDIARWNDRTSPRKTLETFWFAVLSYDVAPELIVNAIDCLDLSALDPGMRERDAALMAHELNLILNRCDVPLYGVPERPAGDSVALSDEPGMHLVLARQEDGLWKFDRETVGRIGAMRARVRAGQRELEKARSAMAEGRTDPATSLRGFTVSAMGLRDYADAARYLDLRDIPPKHRAIKGPELARKLAFVMQRCGFAYPQEVPSDPDGFRYVWHSNHHGRIMLERVRTAEGPEAWVFSRNTLMNLDGLVEGFRQAAPDPRYARLGVLVDASALAGPDRPASPPPGTPAGLGSPRDTMATFLAALDELEFDDAKAREAVGCLDLSGLSADDRDALGLRLALKLEPVLRRLRVDLLAIADSWGADPPVLGRDSAWQVTFARGGDGAWRFDADTVGRIPEMFERLAPEEKTAREHRSATSSPRQAVRTLLRAVERGDLDLAAETLDLREIPPGARAELGPVLAFKLGYVLERLGHIAVQEIPDEPDTPPYYCYRGPLGRVVVAQGAGEAPGRAKWQFTPETVARAEAMFHAVLAREGGPRASAGVAKAPPSLWLRLKTSAVSCRTALGLAGFQWIGLGVFAIAAALSGLAVLAVADLATRRLLKLARIELPRPFVWTRLRPLALQVALWNLYLMVRLLDLPAVLVAALFPAFKLAWVGLLAWTACRLIDLVMALYSGSERFGARRNLSDLIVPTAARGLKLSLLLVGAGAVVYLIGSNELLTKMLAGLGLVGLAASLAAQDTLKNFFATLLLIGEHPFRIGDHIVVDGLEGTVESVGFRSTRLRTFEDSVLTIPNSTIASASIDNRGLRKMRRFRSLISLEYGTPLDRLTTLRDALRAAVAERPELVRADKTDIHLYELADSSVNLLVQVYFWVATFSEEMEARDWLTREILALSERNGVGIAFPTQTLHVAQPGEAPPATISGAAHQAHGNPAPHLLARAASERAQP
jgi:MscS family membrane protein